MSTKSRRERRRQRRAQRSYRERVEYGGSGFGRVSPGTFEVRAGPMPVLTETSTGPVLASSSINAEAIRQFARLDQLMGPGFEPALPPAAGEARRGLEAMSAALDRAFRGQGMTYAVDWADRPDQHQILRDLAAISDRSPHLRRLGVWTPDRERALGRIFKGGGVAVRIKGSAQIHGGPSVFPVEGWFITLGADWLEALAVRFDQLQEASELYELRFSAEHEGSCWRMEAFCTPATGPVFRAPL